MIKSLSYCVNVVKVKTCSRLILRKSQRKLAISGLPIETLTQTQQALASSFCITSPVKRVKCRANLDYDHLTDRANRDETSKNIENRKGVGDIDRLLHLSDQMQKAQSEKEVPSQIVQVRAMELDKAVNCNEEVQLTPGICPKHKEEKMKVIFACSKCNHPMCFLCQSLMECPQCGRMKDRGDVEELWKSTKKLNRKLDELVNRNEHNAEKATELLKGFEMVQGKLNIDFNTTQKFIEEHYSKLLENAAESIKHLKEQITYATSKEIKKVQVSIDTLNQYKKDCELACSKAVLARKAAPLEVSRIFSAVKAQLEASCPKVKVDEPRRMFVIPPSDDELESDVSRLAGFVLRLQHTVINEPKMEDGYDRYDAVYNEYRESTFISSGHRGLYEAGAGGVRNFDEMYDSSLCLSVCGRKLYRGSYDAVHMFDLTEESGELKPIGIMTVPDGGYIWNVSVSAGGRVAVANGVSVYILTQDGVRREIHMPRDGALFGSSCPVSVQWVGEQSLCMVLNDGRVVLVSLDPVATVWMIELTKPFKVSFAGGRLFVSHDGDESNQLTVLDERGGAVIGVITCPGEQALRVCTLQNGTIAALSYNRQPKT